MKTLKFRAWSESQKEWHYFTPANISTYKQTFEMHTLQGDEFYLFTGLLDKNGKEIYEGDIVLCSDDGENFPEQYDKEKDKYYPIGKYEVEYQGEQGYAAFELKNNPCEDMSGLCYAHANSIEVIGNIYEHPELMKERV